MASSYKLNRSRQQGFRLRQAPTIDRIIGNRLHSKNLLILVVSFSFATFSTIGQHKIFGTYLPRDGQSKRYSFQQNLFRGGSYLDFCFSSIYQIVMQHYSLLILSPLVETNSMGKYLSSATLLHVICRSGHHQRFQNLSRPFPVLDSIIIHIFIFFSSTFLSIPISARMLALFLNPILIS